MQQGVTNLVKNTAFKRPTSAGNCIFAEERTGPILIEDG